MITFLYPGIPRTIQRLVSTKKEVYDGQFPTLHEFCSSKMANANTFSQDNSQQFAMDSSRIRAGTDENLFLCPGQILFHPLLCTTEVEGRGTEEGGGEEEDDDG